MSNGPSASTDSAAGTAPTSGSMATILDAFPVNAAKGITTKEDLRNHLIQAAAVETQTIPMYLYALYSIAGQGHSRWAAGTGAHRLIRSIVVEEMLHLCLVRNILVALGFGDQVRFYDEDFVPDFPEYMLHRHPALLLRLSRCDRRLIRDVFMEFERPDAPPAEGTPPKGQYATIGQFYKSIGTGLKRLDAAEPQSLWAGNKPELQYVAAYWNNDGGGEPMLVKDLSTAQQALKMIVDQGEGVDPAKPSVPVDVLYPVPGIDELPHFHKFQRIAEGIEPIGPTWKVPTDPKSFQFGDDAAASSISNLFNAAYCYVLHLIDVLYQTPSTDVVPGKKSPRYGHERLFMSAMQGVLANTAEIMVATPARAGEMAKRKLQMAPTFEYYSHLPASGKKQHLIELCDKAVDHFPQLGGDNSVRWLLGKMPDV
ncbi:ferritin-like domain-containing protein [Actinomadura rudentiformis]|uniref:Iminophenyl-pyruvate dimer synthase domain-containing protein n=1 Tax=Actinomadura rudentiformis TaxID=359158 RepID=A0A6H9YT57_9ACTN|nr:ferritin-like protein [Actinomadura rudentiformis]KAB2348804.1 hypothetical protein F8566_13570 [Actinomadura rudentiformis]